MGRLAAASTLALLLVPMLPGAAGGRTNSQGVAAQLGQPPKRASPLRERMHTPVGVAAKATRAPNDPLWRDEWGVRAVDPPRAWLRVVGARPVVVAVVDTGVDATQPDLVGRLVDGWNAVDATANTADDNGHGTMVAGVVAAHANNGLGGAGYCGDCVVMPVKVLDGGGHGPAATIAAGIDWAVAHGADVVNLSLVLTGRDASVSAAVAGAIAAGVVVVAAAGNSGTTTPTYPGSEPGVISVAGEDATRRLYDWSNSGAWVTTQAPGCNVTTFLSAGFGEFCGTSSAAAGVSGVVGSVLAASRMPSARLVAALQTGAGSLSGSLAAAALERLVARATP